MIASTILQGHNFYVNVLYRYEFHIPFLKTIDIVSVDDKRVAPTYGNVFPPQLAPRLSFVGLFHIVSSLCLLI